MAIEGYTPPWEIGGDVAKKMLQSQGPHTVSTLLDPLQGSGAWNDALSKDNRYKMATGGVDSAFGGMNKAGKDNTTAMQGFEKSSNNFLGDDIGSLRNQAYGEGPSYAEKYGAAQRQMAQGDIAKQAMMASGRGGMSAAAQRNAVNQSADVGANMASQIAAARQQEQQQAMQTYLGAQQARHQARKDGFTARQADNQFKGQLLQANQQQQMNEASRFGGMANLAQNRFAQFFGAAEGSDAVPWNK